MIRQRLVWRQLQRQEAAGDWGIIEGSIQLTQNAKIMEAERINAISALLNDLTGREAELRRYL